MKKVRELEVKYKHDIHKHITFALPEINKGVVKLSTDYEDSQLSYDMVFNVNLKISVRIRKAKYQQFQDITIRSKTQKGNRTELDKIKDNLAQYYLYSYHNEVNLIEVKIVDVNAIRQLIKQNKYIERNNNDGSGFYAFTFKDLDDINGIVYHYDINDDFEFEF